LVLDGDDTQETRQQKAAALGGAHPRVLTDRPEDWRLASMRIVDVQAAAQAVPIADWPAVRADDWAWLPMTSGTTEKPRAPVISQRALAAFLEWYLATLALRPRERVAHALARNFDAALSEWLPALAGGGVVQTLTPLGRQSIERFEREVRRHRVAIVTLPASYFELWSACNGALPSRLRKVVVGGAPLRSATLQAWQKRCAQSGRQIPVLNVYGPAEATIGVCAFEASGEVATDMDFVPVASSAGAGVTVVDPTGSLVVPGQPGEILLHGDQLMEGVWNGTSMEPRPAEPWRTGDRAVVDALGRVVVTGRRGDWVKLRGRRLHLRGVEAALAVRAELVQVALRIEGSETHPRLRIAVVDAQRRTPQQLREQLEPLLPPGVHPIIQSVSALSLNSSGKPDWDLIMREAAEPGLPIAGPPVERVLSLLRTALGHELAEPTRGFCDNGGDSLAALRFQVLLQQRLGRDMDLEQLFAAPSLARLAESLAQQPEE
jgi:acyl-CoA synthetase (AMP-forming)/AMP-acid ligase II